MTKQSVLQEKYKNVYEYHKALKPTSKTLVCLAGVTEGCFRYYESLPILQEHFNVVLFNNPGIDGAPEEHLFTVEDLAKKFQHILNLLEIESYYLLGHSMGGFVAQRMAINKPNKVNKLVLFGTSFGSFQSGEDAKHIMDVQNTVQKTVERAKKHERVLRQEEYVFTPEFIKENPKIVEHYLDEKEKYFPAKGVIASHFLCGGRFSSVNEGHKITMPTLIIHGEQDKMVNVEGGKILAKTIPDSQILLLPKSGHTPFTEDVTIMKNVLRFILDGEQVGEILPKDFTFSKEQLEQDKHFRRHSLSSTYGNFFKELFMVDKIEENINKYKEFVKSFKLIQD
jgi:pimeloyl-ACP methyl ester carboxylesterase